VDQATKALNLWDIENRIITVQKELEALHEMKDSILDSHTHDEITCE